MGKALKENVVKKMVQDSVAKATAPVATPVAVQPQPEPAVDPVQQIESGTQISAVEIDEIHRTSRERRTCKLQAAIPPSLYAQILAKSKERELSMAEALIRALRVGLPQI